MNNKIIFDNPDIPIEIIVKYHGLLSKINEKITIDILDENYAIFTLLPNEISELYDFEEIEYIEFPKILSVSLYNSINSICTAPILYDSYNLDGSGTIVALVDSGIDFLHPDFRNEDGTSRILFLWDQETRKEYTRDDINKAISAQEPFEIIPSMDIIGHGTAVAGIAAGNGRASMGRNKGVAYKSDIIAVKLGWKGFESFTRTTEIMRGVKYIIEKSIAHKKPVAINISFGTNDGSHDGSSLFETYLNDMAAKWKTVIVAASGNEGTGGHHYFGNLKTNQSIDVEFSVIPYLKSFYAAVWKNFVDDFQFELISPENRIYKLYSENKISIFKNNEAEIRIYNRNTTPYSRRHEIYFQFVSKSGTIQTGIWKIRIYGVNIVDGQFDIYLPTSEEVSKETAFVFPNPESTLTIPSTAKNLLSVGGYNSILNTAAEFSGRGNLKIEKPDIVAPAVSILCPKSGGGYGNYTGTSMAAPFVTGAAALMMQWGIVNGNDPFLYGERLKSYLIKGAKRFGYINYPNSIWGYGALCLNDSLNIISGRR